MIAAADASPLNYLVLAGAVDVLAPLYSRVLVPRTVVEELLQAGTPVAVRTWITRPPEWIEILPDPPLDPTLATLDAGERAAIALALSLHADVLLIDDWDGRAEAMRRDLRVTCTLGVLANAHRHRCSILRTRWRAFGRRTCIFRRNSSISYGVVCPPRRRNNDCPPPRAKVFRRKA